MHAAYHSAEKKREVGIRKSRINFPLARVRSCGTKSII